jgi:monoamine oxidase
LTRREFLEKSATAGYTLPAMLAMGMIPPAPAHAFRLSGESHGKHIVILGAGLAGLSAAYELKKLGYTCTLLEARQRVGGRCWSIRKGTIHTEAKNENQVADFDEGLYFNAGPSRIPHHHQLTLHYCRELGVELEVYNNINESAYFYSEGTGKLSNKKIRMREIHNDIRGYSSELLAKAVDHKSLDSEMSSEDAQKFVEYLRAEGGLNIDKLYKPSARRGYIETPAAGLKQGVVGEAHSLTDMIQSGLMDPDFYNVAEYTYELQMTLLQAKGGMDRIAKAFDLKLENEIRTGCEVRAVKNQEKTVNVTYRKDGVLHEITGDYCICTLPLTVLSNIEHNFSSDVSRAIDFVPYIATGKIGLQFKRRFWEEDENIFGGITHTNNELTQIFYPSNDYLSKKGVLIGYYNFNDKARRTGILSNSEREQLALRKGRLIHPQYDAEFEKSFSVSWHLTPYSLGGWAVYNKEERQGHYKVLINGEGNVYFAGEHTSYLNAWMAGAFESARVCVSAIHSRTNENHYQYPSSK